MFSHLMAKAVVTDGLLIRLQFSFFVSSGVEARRADQVANEEGDEGDDGRATATRERNGLTLE